jgi:hypothetical protein
VPQSSQQQKWKFDMPQVTCNVSKEMKVQYLLAQVTENPLEGPKFRIGTTRDCCTNCTFKPYLKHLHHKDKSPPVLSVPNY